jgi:uncharacterized UBP type Zn finger protein
VVVSRHPGDRDTASALPRAHRTTCQVTQFCDHYGADLRVDQPLGVCTACVEIGAAWVHLRQCLACGQTSCCDQSPNRHATAHYRETGHPMIRTAETDEDWQWCYPDDRLYLQGATGDEVPEA